ncbi:MFS transporter [Mycobacterium sp. URHB0044]|uniref:MFS transporter n=1 Tax=Mycobacterium sp. URHB0044 TaxID=1380386 RepID=UPI00055B5480|nr:MFS transporter [Mycobacterium sp. URHB0044]
MPLPAFAPAPTSRVRRVLPGGLALTGAALTFTSLYLAAGALMPLLVVYQQQWDLAPAVLALAFAVFAVGFLAAVLTVGSLSDHVGRRPVLFGALTVQLVSNVAFLIAPDVGWVIAGRVLQGIATGAATTAFTAALVEIAPPNRKRLGVILGSICLTGGLASGSLLAGLLIQFTTTANSTIFIGLTVATILGVAVIAFCPESMARTPGALRSLLPRIAVPSSARAEFVAGAPVIAAVWMLSGLSGGLSPAMVRSIFHVDSGLLNGVSGFVAPAASVGIGLGFARLDPRRSMIIGIFMSIVGAAVIVGGLAGGWLPVMIIGQAIGGAGFGASFTAFLRLVVRLVAPHEHAGIAALTYLVSYSAFGIPVVIAGFVVGRLGMESTVFWYAGVTVLLALISLRAQLQINRG